MNCACDTDEKGNVTAACGAHMDWYRRNSFNQCEMPYHKRVPMMEAEIKYLKKSQGVLLGLLVEKLGVDEPEE